MIKFAHIYCFIFFISCLSVSSIEHQNNDVLQNIVATMRHASNYLDIAKDVADLVSSSFGRTQNKKRGNDEEIKHNYENNFIQTNFITGFFRLLGLDSHKIIAIAVNSVIFLAQLISSLFDLNPQIEQARNSNLDESLWDPMQYIIENNNERENHIFTILNEQFKNPSNVMSIKRLVQEAQDPNLPNKLINRVDGFDSSCIRLLICKTSPVIWAAQNSLKNKSVSFMKRMTSWLPSWHEFENNSETCEEKHIDCTLFPQS